MASAPAKPVGSEAELLELLAGVKDPEVPVLDIVELGIVRRAEPGPRPKITLTPTYSGCPAMKMIEDEIRALLAQHGMPEAEIRTVYSPPWSSEWLSEAAREKLKAYGIAPPLSGAAQSELVSFPKRGGAIVPCPFCGSGETELRSQFGSTACKALFFCRACRQPFEYFKSI